ncbi:MAG: hypothetical protein ACLGXA_06790 [Acidobacteriota bacterium]
MKPALSVMSNQSPRASRHCRPRLLVSAILVGVLACVLCPRAEAEIHLPKDAAACVRWAAGDLGDAVRSAGIDPSQARVDVLLLGAVEEDLPRAISIEEQSFSLEVAGTAVQIRAGGAVGAMYGLEELAEQIRNAASARPASWRQVAILIKPTSQKPYLEIRADNMFIHTRGTSEPAPPGGYPLLVNDHAMWHAYIDLLARNRYNLLDLHGAYDLESTSFPNLYPMLVHVPDYPNVGDEAVQRRNLASLRAIIAYAESRGIRVSLMNYSANNGRGGRYKNEPSVTGVPPDRLADYTAKAVALLIRALPDLYMLGFRVGESTQLAGFYRDAYLRGVQEAGRTSLRLYTRSWQTTKEQLLPIAQAAHAGLDIEIKFNGEHLGLPYQSMQGPAYGSYSYQNYLDLPADYRILWQIRANGTHRFWAWENTEFIRRTVRSCRLGNALGFTLEPHIAYFSVDSAQYYRSTDDIGVYRWIWQKHWMWYYAWGRLGYDPDLPDRNVVRAFNRHYGAAGETAYRAMQESSRIVPLVYAYRFQGPDQRDYSPETETGNFDTKKKRARQDLLQFAENHPEDSRSFVGIDQYVRERIAGTPDGRIGPFRIARRLSDAARETRALLASAPTVSGSDAAAWRLLRDDLLLAADLGDYAAARIRGMTWLESALQSGNSDDDAAAVRDLAASRLAWKQLSDAADRVYRPLSNPLRHQIDFQWSSQSAPLAQLDATADSFRPLHRLQTPRLPLQPSAVDFGHISLTDHEADGNAIVQYASDRATAVTSVILWWKPLPSELPWQSAAMTRELGKKSEWRFTLPLDARGLMYMVELRNATGAAENFPEEFDTTPWRIIPPFPATTR